MAVDVLDHHDGIDHHEPDRDGEPHQRNIVEAEIKREHRRKRAEQRQHHRHAGNESCPEAAQEMGTVLPFPRTPARCILSCSSN
jgi:hypothetical protein